MVCLLIGVVIAVIAVAVVVVVVVVFVRSNHFLLVLFDLATKLCL